MTQIVPGTSKGPVFKRGQTLTAGDICRLQKMGRQNIYVAEENEIGSEWVHEDEASLSFAQALAGEGVKVDGVPQEGKITLVAEIDGLLVVDTERLEQFNLVPGVMCASRKSFRVVDRGHNLAGTRAIPLFLPQKDFQKALSVLRDGPIFNVFPMKQAKIGILSTGSEVFQGLVEDKFIPIIKAKVEKFGCSVIRQMIVPDDREVICGEIKEMIKAGVEILVTTAGLSVDPDDVTRQGIRDAGATDMLYGAPILPGAMTLLAKIDTVQVMGVPACALYYKTTSFDLLLPRVLAGLTVTRQELAKLGHGAMCLDCKTCTYQKCTFGT
jgi:formylmethanofuran dehydrogenase subunit E